MPETVMSVTPTVYGHAAVCSVHGAVAFYTSADGAAYAAVGHATTFHTPHPRAVTLDGLSRRDPR